MSQREGLPDDVPLDLTAKDDRLKIVIDTREQKGWTFSGSQVDVVRKALPAGDYSVEGLETKVVLERKNLGDFVNTVIHDWIRFRKELIRLSGYDFAAVVVEADAADVYEKRYESEALPASVIGRMNGVMLDHGVGVLFWGRDKRICSDLAHRFLLLAWKKMAHLIEVP
jgi:DNA excision repair protein ERCC-4